MAEFTLYLSNPASPELNRTCFEHPLLEEKLYCVRGKTEGAHKGCSSFQWTAAVKAMTVFFLRAKLRAQTVADSPSALLEGEGGSPAASLDYALGKVPLWIYDMFGSDSKGTPLAQRFIARTNPEQKRKGPVGLSLNTGVLPCEKIHILCEDQEIKNTETLRAFSERIESSFDAPSLKYEDSSGSGALEAPDHRSPSITDLREVLPELLKDEIVSRLRDTDIFQRENLLRHLSKLVKNPRFSELSGNCEQLVSAVDLELATTERLGINEEAPDLSVLFDRDKPLRAAVSVSQISAIAVLMYLRDIKGYPLELNFRFPHSLRLVEKLIDGSGDKIADICVLAQGPAAALFGSRCEHYSPLMMMPKQSYRVVGSEPGHTSGPLAYEGIYLILTEKYSNALFYLDALKEAGHLKDNVEVRHMEPDEATQALKDSGEKLRSIVGFPYYHFNELFSNFRLVGEADESLSFRNSFLFMHNSLYQDKAKVRLLDIAIRDAWLSLREGGEALDQVLKNFLEDQEYLTLTKRFAGLYTL